MAKGQVGEREAELMLKWRKQGRWLNEVMTLTGRAQEPVPNHTDPERKLRTGFGRPKCIRSRAFVKLEKALDLPPSGPAKHPLATVSAQV